MMDESNNISTVTTDTVTKKPFGRPKGSKKRLGLPLEERLKILKKIAKSTDPEIKDCDRLGAVKLMTELLADKVNPAERMLPVYRLEFVLDKSGKVSDKSPVTASNPAPEPVKVVDQAPTIPLPNYNDPTQDDIGQEIKENEGEEQGEKESDSLF